MYKKLWKENHHIATIIVIMNSNKKHEEMLKLIDESWMRNRILYNLKVSPHTVPRKLQRRKVEQYEGKPDRYHITQVTLMGQINILLPNRMQWEKHIITSVMCLPKMHNPNLIIRKHLKSFRDSLQTNWLAIFSTVKQ